MLVNEENHQNASLLQFPIGIKQAVVINNKFICLEMYITDIYS